MGELIVSTLALDGRAWILSDGDPAGERHAYSVLSHISQHRFVRWLKLDEGKQPTDLSSQELKLCFVV
jgi:DNA primase